MRHVRFPLYNVIAKYILRYEIEIFSGYVILMYLLANFRGQSAAVNYLLVRFGHIFQNIIYVARFANEYLVYVLEVVSAERPLKKIVAVRNLHFMLSGRKVPLFEYFPNHLTVGYI